MSGIAGVLTLYDEDGNPVYVKLVDGKYQLLTHDERVVQSLDEIKLLLVQILEELRK